MLNNFTTMKQLSILILSILSYSFSYNSNAQCKEDDLMETCDIPEYDFTFLKTYSVLADGIKASKKAQENEYQYILSKDTEYMITSCDPGNPKMIVTLYDPFKRMVLTNYDKKNNKFYTNVGYKCMTTGIYYLRFTFPDDASGGAGCGLGILSFKK
jgi:hypothetical protein